MTAWLIILFIALFLLAALYIVSYIFFKTAFCAKRPKAKQSAPRIKLKKTPDATPVKDDSGEWYAAQRWEQLSIKSQDGLTLKADYLKQGDGTRLALIIHGWTGSRQEMGAMARMYSGMGFSLLLPDLRGCGQSQGAYYTFGYRDHSDMLSWIDEAISLGAKQILATGHSMGGATVMMLSSLKLPGQVKCIVEDCGYTDLRAQFFVTLHKLLPRALHLIIKPMMYVTDHINHAHQHFYFSDVSPVKSVAEATVPLLFIHGDKDGFIPTSMAEENFAACTAKKERLIVKGAEHCKSILVDKTAYEQTVRAFALKYIAF